MPRPRRACDRRGRIATVVAARLDPRESSRIDACLSTEMKDRTPWPTTRTVLFKSKPVELAGPQLKPGDKAPDFSCVGAGLSVSDWPIPAGKARLFNVVPSLDTPVCNTQTRRFNEELNALGDKVAAYTVSLDLPFAQQRWCTEAKVENLKNLSDVRDHSFGEHYGVLIKGLPIPLLARAVFVVDAQDTIRYAEIVPDIAPGARLRARAQGVERGRGGLITVPNRRSRHGPRSGSVSAPWREAMCASVPCGTSLNPPGA